MNAGQRTPITIKDIAAYAGVSVGTASKVLNDKGNVREGLRLRVLAVTEKLNYRPSALARSIKRRKTDTISLVIPMILNSFYVRVIYEIEKIAFERNYTLLLGNSDEDVVSEVRYLRQFADMRIDGLILATTGRADPTTVRKELEVYTALGIPVVLIVRSLESVSLDAVLLDNAQGAYDAVRHLLDMGHRRIGIISSSARTSASAERIDGYTRALEEHGVPFDRRLVQVGRLTLDSGGDLLRGLLSLESPPTAVFVASAYQLLGAYTAVKELGVRIPEDLSLIAFDDAEWASFVDPPLTVVRPHLKEVCRSAMQLLLERIEGHYSGPGRESRVPTELVVRKSVSDRRAALSGHR